MKRVLILLCVFISINVFAWDKKARCGLKMQVVDVEGLAMPGLYQVVHILVTNPTDTVACIPENTPLGTWRFYFDEETGNQSYYNTGYYNEELRLNPGEEKTISINAQIFKLPEGYVQIVATGDGGSYMHLLEEYFCNMAVDVIPYEDWDLTTDITVEGLEKEDDMNVLYAQEVSAVLSCTNNQSEVFTPGAYCLELNGYYLKSIEKQYRLGDLYLLPNETYEKRITFDGLKERTTYCISLYNRTGMVPWDAKLIYETEPFVIDITQGIDSVCETESATSGIYSLNGTRLVDEPKKGIFIKDGKKIVR